MIAGLRSVFKRLKEIYVLGEINKAWRKINKHNFTNLISDIKFDKVRVGKYTYGDLNIHSFSSESNISIGNYCSIADGVVFLLAGNHETNTISTFPFKNKIVDSKPESLSKGNIVVEDDVWIGKDALILSGVHLGQGCIVAARAVVTKDVPPYSIVAGVPAKVIKHRFNKGLIEKIKEINWKNCDETFINENIGLLYERIDDSNIDEILDHFHFNEK